MLEMKKGFAFWHLDAGFHTDAVGGVFGGHEVLLPKSANPAGLKVCAVKAGSQSQISSADQDIVFGVYFQFIVSPACDSLIISEMCCIHNGFKLHKFCR